MLYRLIALVTLVSTLGYADVAMVKSDEIYARSYGARTLATLNKALDAIGSAEKTLVVDGGVWSITDDVTIPENVTLDVRKGSTKSLDFSPACYQPEPSKVNAGITTITPKYFGEQIYNEYDGIWYKSHGIYTNDWDALN
ncbi:hypothetical protein EOL73_00090 [Candidatus Saccharibacteria bacterium]|nr:hypothetical protein [Candidatus Saccharibacteria bacterium]